MFVVITGRDIMIAAYCFNIGFRGDRPNPIAHLT